MYGECAGNFLHVQEFPAKCRKFLAQLAHVQEEYKEALNYSCTCKKYGDVAGIFPTLFHFFLHFLINSLRVGRMRDATGTVPRNVGRFTGAAPLHAYVVCAHA